MRVVILSTGERFPLLTEGGAYGLPDSEVTRYTLAALRPRNAVATMRRKLLAIALGKCFCDSRGIDLVERAAKGTFLTRAELISLADACRRTRGDGRAVHATHAANRFNAFLDFALWEAEPVIARVSDAADRARLIDDQRQFRARAAAARPAVQGPAGAVPTVRERFGLNPEQRDLLLRAIEPGSPENPWGQGMQHRNRAIVATAYRFGLRTGEMLGLKTRDLKQSGSPATLTIHRRQDDPEDPRTDQPVAKTHGRVLEVEESHRKILSEWILEHRKDRERFPAARRHPFLWSRPSMWWK